MKIKKNIFIFGICVCLLVISVVTATLVGAFDELFSVENSEDLDFSAESNSITDNSNDSSEAEEDSEEKTSSESQTTNVVLDEKTLLSMRINEDFEPYDPERTCQMLKQIINFSEIDYQIGEFTEEQHAALSEIYINYDRIRPKKVLEILGAIEPGCPMITVEQAMEICSSPDMIALRANYKYPEDVGKEIAKRFNEIARAPDIYYATVHGVACRYFLNENGSRYILVSFYSSDWEIIDLNTRSSKYLFEQDKIEAERAEAVQQNVKENSEVKYKDYAYYYESATEAQRKALEKIKTVVEENADVGKTESQYYEKKILEILGEIPKDMPMLTLRYVKEVCADPAIVKMKEEINSSGSTDLEKSKKFTEAVIAKFNEVAGAADVRTSSLRSPIVYFLNKEHTEYILINAGNVFYVTVDENGDTSYKEGLFDNLVTVKDGVNVNFIK